MIAIKEDLFLGSNWENSTLQAGIWYLKGQERVLFEGRIIITFIKDLSAAASIASGLDIYYVGHA